jgi:hypothetical protein
VGPEGSLSCSQEPATDPYPENQTNPGKTSIIHFSNESRDSSVCIALGYGLDERGSRVRFPAGAGNFSLHHRSRMALGPIQPPIKWVPGFFSLRVKRLGREADHSPPSSAEVKECVELYFHSSTTPSWHGA